MEVIDEIKFMRRCLDLAAKAEGLTYPNPLVGAVVVCDGKIIGEGYHLKAGGPHAEVIAINSVADREKLKRSTLFINLEPCSHYGRTPPCADLIISSLIPRVVTGTSDSSDKVSGRGISMLRDAGCEVLNGVCEKECRRINKRFFTFHEKQRPYITLKWAQSSDGFLDIMRTGEHNIEPTWITGNPERTLVHKWRASEQAILAGAATVRADNPKLNVREWGGNDPLRLILSGSGIIDKGSAFLHGNKAPVVFTHNSKADIPGAVRIRLDTKLPACTQIAQYLFDSGIQSLLIEGGARVLAHFISQGLWDEARVFTGEKDFGSGVKAPAIKGTPITRHVFSKSVLNVYLNSED
jgi:diaminohydroxyphosphoribosylaminopyrimidine deaminase / 5-amino-6-(5-phosphoribosylamino)uracil reductase